MNRPDPITLRRRLLSQGKLDPLTEKAILDVSTMFATMPQDLAADIVAELAGRQRVKDAAGRLLRSSHNPKAPITEALVCVRFFTSIADVRWFVGGFAGTGS